MNTRANLITKVIYLTSKREDQRSVKRDRGGYLNKKDYDRYFQEWWDSHIDVYGDSSFLKQMKMR